MKKLSILVLMAIMVSLNGFGQKIVSYSDKRDNVQFRHSMRIGVNAAFFGAGDRMGHTLNADYSFHLTPAVAVSARIMTGWSREVSSIEQSTNLSTLTTNAAALTVRVSPIKVCRWLSLEAGLLHQSIMTIYGNTGYTTGTGIGISPNIDFNLEKKLYGFIYTLDVSFYQNDRLFFGARGDMLTSFTHRTYNCDSLQAGLYFGVRF